MKQLSVLFFILAAFQIAGAQEERPSATLNHSSPISQNTAKSLTGTYRNKSSEFKVLALGGDKLRIRFEGTYAYQVNGELTANTGEGEGEAQLNGNVAAFVPEETQNCKITLKFMGRKLIVTQEGTDADCGFGNRVYANGTYLKRSSRRPKFEQ